MGFFAPSWIASAVGVPPFSSCIFSFYYPGLMLFHHETEFFFFFIYTICFNFDTCLDWTQFCPSNRQWASLFKKDPPLFFPVLYLNHPVSSKYDGKAAKPSKVSVLFFLSRVFFPLFFFLLWFFSPYYFSLPINMTKKLQIS